MIKIMIKFEFMLILVATLDKNSMTTTAWCRKALDLTASYRMHLFWKQVRQTQRFCDYQLQTQLC